MHRVHLYVKVRISFDVEGCHNAQDAAEKVMADPETWRNICHKLDGEDYGYAQEVDDIALVDVIDKDGNVVKYAGEVDVSKM